MAVIALGGLPAMYAWSALWATTSAPRLLWGPVTFLMILGELFGAVVLYLYVRDRANPRANLDERERQLRDRAMVLAYQVLSAAVVVAVGAVALLVLGFGRSLTLDPAWAGAAAICAGVLVPLLPTAALAWIEPDPATDD